MRRECDCVGHRQLINMIKTYYKYPLILGSKSVIYDHRTPAVGALIFINQVVGLARPRSERRNAMIFHES